MLGSSVAPIAFFSAQMFAVVSMIVQVLLFFCMCGQPLPLLHEDNLSLFSTPIQVANANNGSIAKIAKSFLSTHYQLPLSSIHVTDVYTDQLTNTSHVYAQQVARNGRIVIDGLANVNINGQGHVISSSQSFALLQGYTEFSDSNLSLGESIKTLARRVNTPLMDDSILELGSFDNEGIIKLPEDVAVNGECRAKQVLVKTNNSQLTPAWHLVLRQHNDWWCACVVNQEVVQLNNWAYKGHQFKVFPKSVESPLQQPQPQIVANPASPKASPHGWVTRDTTAGNNVWAQDNPTGGNEWQNNHRPKAHPEFDFPLDLTKEPPSYVDFAITQLFYTINVMHDLSYTYGFDEAAGNFQDINYSGQGVGGDYVVAFAQDGSGKDNSMFMSPPDGQHGVMRMFIWDVTTLDRDGDLDQGIVAHEFTHGISNRLTGGPSNANCLNGDIPGGMGEGWSDTMANVMRIKPGDRRTLEMEMGVYVYGRNIRHYPYSTNMRKNPATYGWLNKPGYKEVHMVGEVWASLLYEVIWNLVDKHGVGDLYKRDLNKGNCLFLQLLLDGMKLQPCNPSFIDARNAILQADQQLTKGNNLCAMWRGFAKRGLGVNARQVRYYHLEDFHVPNACISK